MPTVASVGLLSLLFLLVNMLFLVFSVEIAVLPRLQQRKTLCLVSISYWFEMISHFLDFVRCNLFLHIYYSVFKVQLLQLFSCSGGDKGIRTLDPLRAKQVLSQLSYIPIKLIVQKFVSLERRWSSRTFRYGYLVTTSPQLSAPPSAAPSLIGWVTDFGRCWLPWCDGRCVQDPGTYSPRHADSRLLAIPASCSRVADYSPNWDVIFRFAPDRSFASLCLRHCSTCVAAVIDRRASCRERV